VLHKAQNYPSLLLTVCTDEVNTNLICFTIVLFPDSPAP